MTTARNLRRRQHVAARKAARTASKALGCICRPDIRLNNAGLETSRFIAKEPTLDDVFFQILGEDKEETYANSH